MKEGKLSSALMKRYSISKKNAKGTVLWHSLNEQGEIGVYDMKFGTTIVRNILAEDVKPILIKEHEHAKRDDDDPERVDEEWKGDPEIKQLDKYGKDEMSKDELCKKRNTLKDKDSRTSKESTELRRINFAIRSRQKGKKFGKVDC